MNAKKAEIVARIAAQRPMLSRHYAGIRRGASITRRLQRSTGAYPSVWMAGAASLGWLLSRIPARKKRIYVDSLGDKKVRRGFFAAVIIGLLKIAADLAKPAVIAFASKKVADSLALTSKVQKRALEQKRLR